MSRARRANLATVQAHSSNAAWPSARNRFAVAVGGLQADSRAGSGQDRHAGSSTPQPKAGASPVRLRRYAATSPSAAGLAFARAAPPLVLDERPVRARSVQARFPACGPAKTPMPPDTRRARRAFIVECVWRARAVRRSFAGGWSPARRAKHAIASSRRKSAGETPLAESPAGQSFRLPIGDAAPPIRGRFRRRRPTADGRREPFRRRRPELAARRIGRCRIPEDTAGRSNLRD